PVGVQALLDVLPLVAAEVRHGVGDDAASAHRPPPSRSHHARYQSSVSPTPVSSETFGVTPVSACRRVRSGQRRSGEPAGAGIRASAGAYPARRDTSPARSSTTLSS